MKNNTTNTGGETTMATKSYKTTELQDRLAERLAATEYAPGRTFAGSWWGRGDRAERFYFGDSANMRKDGKVIRNKVWLQFDDPASTIYFEEFHGDCETHSLLLLRVGNDGLTERHSSVIRRHPVM